VSIKTLSYFPAQSAGNSPPVISAILTALHANGFQTKENTWDTDAAIIWSVLWNGRMRANQQVYEHYRQSNRPVIIIEVGALHRGHTWKVSVNHVTSQGYYGHTQDLDFDRPAKLGIKLSTNNHSRPEIVIAAQHSRSLQVQHLPSQESWVLDRIRDLQAVSDRPIVVRPHPRSRLNLSSLPTGARLEMPRPVPNTYDGFDLAYSYHAVVNHNSGPGIQAAIAGCRPIVHESILAAPVSVAVEDIEKSYDADRHRWLTEICHTEYTSDELTEGLWLKRIAPCLGL
jgi:hypothetical protein